MINRNVRTATNARARVRKSVARKSRCAISNEGEHTAAVSNEPAIVACKGFWGAQPLFFCWDGAQLMASQHIAFLAFSKMGEAITGEKGFEIGREYTRGSQKGYPYATLKGTDSPTLSFRFGYHGSPLATIATFPIEEPGYYVTLGDLGAVKFRSLTCRDIMPDNPQACFIGDEALEKRFSRKLDRRSMATNVAQAFYPKKGGSWTLGR